MDPLLVLLCVQGQAQDQLHGRRRKALEAGKKGREKMLEGRDWEKRGLLIDLEVVSRHVAGEVDEMARQERVALRTQDKVLGVPRVRREM